MALYTYVKAPPQKPKKTMFTRFVSTTLALTGTALIAWVVYPIISFELTSRAKFTTIISPVPEKHERYALTYNEPFIPDNNQATNTTSEVLGDTNELEAQALIQHDKTDYTDINAWLPRRTQSRSSNAGRIYTLSIPKLNIQDAKVIISGDSLDKSLIHYGGTGLPGEYGTAVIFGHSILPQFYDPKNYKAIFSLLPKLHERDGKIEGDEIFVTFDGITYRYEVVDMRVTSPEDISVLEQRYDSSYIKLITCVPPGTYWKRLVVQARLTPQ